MSDFDSFCSKEKRKRILKRNPLKNLSVMVRLNPYAAVEKKAAKFDEQRRKAAKQAKLDVRRGVSGGYL